MYEKNQVKIVAGVVLILFLCLLIYIYAPKMSSLPWSGPHFSSYEMSNGHYVYLYPLSSESFYVYDANIKHGKYFNAYSGNEGPFVYVEGNKKEVMQFHGNTISIENVPNNAGVNPTYYLIGNKIPNVYSTRSLTGTYTITDRNIVGKAVRGEIPPGFIGNIKIQSTGSDIWVITDNNPRNSVLFQKFLDNGYNATTYSGVFSTPNTNIKIIFYDSVNFEMLVYDKNNKIRVLNGTRTQDY